MIDYLYETDEYSYDEVKYDAILAEIDKLNPMSENSGTEESLVVFHEKYASLFTSTEKFEPQ